MMIPQKLTNLLTRLQYHEDTLKAFVELHSRIQRKSPEYSTIINKHNQEIETIKAELKQHGICFRTETYYD